LIYCIILYSCIRLIDIIVALLYKSHLFV